MTSRSRNPIHRGAAGIQLLALALALLLGCSVNPATGQRQLVLMGEQQEIAIGQENPAWLQTLLRTSSDLGKHLLLGPRPELFLRIGIHFTVGTAVPAATVGYLKY